MPTHINDLDTPALIVDLDIMESNLARMASYARQHNLRLRPHTKTHKSPILAAKQLALGAAGLTVAKPGEAEVMLEANPSDILVAFPTFGPAKMERLRRVAQRAALTVAVDSLDAARQLSDAGINSGILVEFDAGLGRAGIHPQDLPAFITELKKLPHTHYAGVSFYPGHIKSLDDEGLERLQDLNRLLERTLDQLTRSGHTPTIVSGGSTPTWPHSHRIHGVNEIRPGTYIFNDRNTINSAACTLAECAARLLVTVVSTAKPGQILIDGGSKTFSSDRLNGDSGVSFGLVLDAPEAHFHKMNEEHGFIDISHANRPFHVGEKLEILMNHVCVAMNLQDTVYGHRNGIVETSWTVAARGKLQ